MSESKVGTDSELEKALNSVEDWSTQRIRVSQFEYDNIPKTGEYVHVNVGSTSHKAGEYYAFSKIVGHEFHAVGKATPILGTGTLLIGRCLEVTYDVSIGEISEDDYSHMMIHMQNRESLEKVMVTRYGHTPKAVTKENVANQKFTLTKLEIIGEVDDLGIRT